jgi:DNA-binding XRE family transcriptional regulator
MKMQLTEKEIIKTRMKEDLSLFKKIYLRIFSTEDLSFIKELHAEFEDLLSHTGSEVISADKAFKKLTEDSSKPGALLKRLRIREGLTQIEFAKLIGTTQANLSSMENGTRPIGKVKAKLIADKFDADYRYFL